MALDRPAHSFAHRDDPTPPSPHGDEPPYRDSTQAARQEIARLHKSLDAAIEAMRATAGPVYGARRARVVAGSVLVGCALLVVAGIIGSRVFAIAHLVVTPVLLVSWPAAGLAFVLAAVCARRDFARRMRAPIRETRDVHADLERLRHYDPGQHAMRMLSETEAVSFGLLLAGAAALLPLTIHFIVGQTLDALDGRRDISFMLVFDGWIWLSIQIAAQCHVVLAVWAWYYGKHLAIVPTSLLLPRGHEQGWKTYRVVWCLAFFPVVALASRLAAFMKGEWVRWLEAGWLEMCVATVGSAILVGMTGTFIPPLYRRAARRLAAERGALATTSTPQALSSDSET